MRTCLKWSNPLTWDSQGGLLGVAPRTEYFGEGVGGGLNFPLGTFSPFPKSGAPAAAPSGPPPTTCPVSPPQVLFSPWRDPPPCSSTRGTPTQTHPGVPPPGGPSRSSRPCTQHKNTQGPPPIIPPPSSPASSPVGSAPTQGSSTPQEATAPLQPLSGWLRWLPALGVAPPPPPGTYLLLDGAQQPLPGLRLCGVTRGNCRSAEGWGPRLGAALPPPRRPASPYPPAPKPWLRALRSECGWRRWLLGASPGCCGRGGAGRAPSDGQGARRQARPRLPHPPESHAGPPRPSLRLRAARHTRSPPRIPRTPRLDLPPEGPPPPPPRSMPTRLLWGREGQHHLFSVCCVPGSEVAGDGGATIDTLLVSVFSSLKWV